MPKFCKTILLGLTFCLLTNLHVQACTNLLVTRGASEDGSIMITYTCDGEFHPILECLPAATHESGDSLEIFDWTGQLRGKIKQVEQTYAVVGLINEYQLAISETTFGGRDELHNPDGLLHYWDLMQLALQRAKTAREAITVMTDLVAEYGYRSTGESFSIADTKEAWILEMIGPGPGVNGAIWVAVKIPDGYISAHANKARIGKIPTKPKKDFFYSTNIKTTAIDRGYYDPDGKEPFRFCEAYCPATPSNQRYADGRVWSIFRRAALSQNFSSDYYRAVDDAAPYPLWIKPDQKLSLSDVFALMRDHYEGTAYDMTKGLDAGPYGNPYRWRPMTWTIDSVDYAWERPISTQQTGFSFVSQSRAKLPNAVGGIIWYGVDDTWFTCYTPLYCSIYALPKSFTVGSLQEFSWDSAWWVFNFVSNYTNLKYSMMIEDVQTVQQTIEAKHLAMQPVIEATTVDLLKSNPELAREYLTDYSIRQAEAMVERWRKLGQDLIVKYNDGYVKNEKGQPQGEGYPEGWLRQVIQARPDQFRLPVKQTDVPESELVD
ncbi:MAG: C69 family dipeptidase [Candidatus Marinimicrobia bacterium]|nr:C69 family dipeptidase [Candidatus Neomarinimicrobiota bacterium]